MFCRCWTLGLRRAVVTTEAKGDNLFRNSCDVTVSPPTEFRNRVHSVGSRAEPVCCSTTSVQTANGQRQCYNAATHEQHHHISFAEVSEILMSSYHSRLGLPTGLVPSCIRTKILHAPLICPIRVTCLANLTLGYRVFWMWLRGESNRGRTSSSPVTMPSEIHNLFT
jgi:hypothetical protein